MKVKIDAATAVVRAIIAQHGGPATATLTAEVNLLIDERYDLDVLYGYNESNQIAEAYFAVLVQGVGTNDETVLDQIINRTPASISFDDGSAVGYEASRTFSEKARVRLGEYLADLLVGDWDYAGIWHTGSGPDAVFLNPYGDRKSSYIILMPPDIIYDGQNEKYVLPRE